MKLILLSLILAFASEMPLVENNTAETSTLGKWEKLGQRKVKRTIDHDAILVTAAEGRFSAIKLKVSRSAINMHRCIVHFGNGDKQNVKIRKDIRAGGETRVINLDGGRKRVIKRVEFWYDTKGLVNNKAVVALWGRH